jgi:hypothetical protein
MTGIPVDMLWVRYGCLGVTGTSGLHTATAQAAMPARRCRDRSYYVR